MARVIRRHWRLFLLQALLIAAGAIFLTLSFTKSPRSAMAAPGGSATPPPAASASAVDPVTYARVRQLREKLALTNQDLAAAGCSQTQATQVLSALLSWYTANASSWDQLEQNQRSAQQQVQAAVRQINVGPKDDTLLAQLPALQQAAASAAQQMDQLILSASPTASALLSSSGQSVWATAQANAALGVPDQYRFATGLTADQVAAMKVLIYRGSDPSSLVSTAGIQASAAASANLSQNMDGVCVADASVLPIPPELQLVPPPTLASGSPAGQ
jgi:hypothetical protein